MKLSTWSKFFPVLLLLFLFSTNRYLGLNSDKALIDYSSDSESYLKISQAFPSFPAKLSMPFYHAQRLAVPYLVGGVAKLTGFDIEAIYFSLVCLVIFLSVFLFSRLTKTMDLNDRLKFLPILFLTLNPYTFRYYIAIPYMVNDLVFELALLALILSLLKDSYTLVIISLLPLALSRQTALLLIPFISLWVFILKTSWPITKRSLFCLLVLGVVGGIYLEEGRLALQFSQANGNVEVLMGLYRWVINSFNLKVFLEFLLRAVIAFVIPISFLIGIMINIKFKNWEKSEKTKFYLLLFAAASVCAQPLLGGPSITGPSVTRLDMLGIVPIVVAISLALKHLSISKEAAIRIFWIVGFILAMGSFHHMYSVIKGSPSEHAFAFAGLQILLGLILLASTLGYQKAYPIN